MTSKNCKCCKCASATDQQHQPGITIMCRVPRADGKVLDKYFPKDIHKHDTHHHTEKHSKPHVEKKEFKLLSEEYIKKHFKLPPRPLYLDPLKRPLITFPMTDEGGLSNFTTDRKAKINQAILDGVLDSSAQICEPSVFPYAEDNCEKEKKKKKKQDNTEYIYILQLPDLEHKCPVHNDIIRTPRFIWHSIKNMDAKIQGAKVPGGDGAQNQGGGSLYKPKTWILSRHTDFDYYSQW